MDNIVIGIDFGTTNSYAAYYIDGIVKILKNREGCPITPSHETIVEKYIEVKPEYGVYEIKRLLGKKFDDPYVQNNLQYLSFKLTDESNEPVVLIEHQNETLKKTPVELCAAILSKIRKDVESKLGQTVDKAVITVPANFNINQREDTLAAAKKAGFTVLKLLNEPTAAALSYYFENDGEEENYALVYDLGGGNFNVAILKRNSININIIAVDGDTHLGGQDFNNLIIDYVCDELEKKYEYDPKKNKRKMKTLQNLCEKAKKKLSVATDTPIILDGFTKNYKSVEILITRKHFERMADDHFKKTIDIVDNCLKSCNLKKSSIKEVILSGGSTRIPKIQEMLSNYFDNRSLNKFVNPDECVAEGAALQAAMLSRNPKQKIEQIKITDVAFRVAPLSLGVGGLANTMIFLIEKNTPLPVSVSIPFVNVHNQQKSMSFDIYEGERLDVRKNHHVGQMSLSNITPAAPGQCEVTVTMTLDQNGVLTVKAKGTCADNNGKDLKKEYTIGRRSDSEVKNALKDAEDHKEEDERFRRFVTLKQYVLRYCMGIIYNLENKNLVNKYKSEYKLCKKIQMKVEDMEMEDEAKLRNLQKKIKDTCDSICRKRDFQFLPTLWI